MKQLSLIAGLVFLFSAFAFGQQEVMPAIDRDGKQIITNQKVEVIETENVNVPVSNRLSPTINAENAVIVQPESVPVIDVEEAERKAVAGGKVEVADTRKAVIPANQKANVKTAIPAKKTPKN